MGLTEVLPVSHAKFPRYESSLRGSNKSLINYEMASLQSRQPTPTGAHKRRPCEWLSKIVIGMCCAGQGASMPF